MLAPVGRSRVQVARSCSAAGQCAARLQRDVKIIGQDAQADALSGNARNIAPRGSRANNLSLSRNALLFPGESVMKGAATLTLSHARLESLRRAGDRRSLRYDGDEGRMKASMSISPWLAV